MTTFNSVVGRGRDGEHTTPVARVTLTGRIVVEAGDRTLDERALPGAQARLVLALLVCERDRAVARDEIADNLWPDARPATWATVLRGVVGRVRGFLVDAGLGGPEVVSADAGTYSLALPDAVEVDVERAIVDTERGEAALTADELTDAVRHLEQARATLARPLLPGIDAPWLDEVRSELQHVRLRALATLGEARLLAGAYDAATAPIEEAIALDPFRESLHRALLRAHLERGDVAAGLRAYERLRELLATELGADPAPQTQELHAALLHAGDPPTEVERDHPPRRATASADGNGARTPASVAASPAVGPPATPRSGVTPDGTSSCPYLGLRPFTEDDAAVFFGRGADVARLLDRLAQSRFLAVLGPSGSGKSSLVRAGLVPALRRGALPGSDTWRITYERAAVDPDHLAAVIAEARDAGERVVIVIDQLEEAFTYHDGATRDRLLDTIVAAVTGPDPTVTLVVTLRADFYPRLASYPRLADLASQQQFLVSPMDEVGLTDAIEGPARAAGLRVEPGLDRRLLSDVARRPGALPLLSHCLVELWERRDGDLLTLAAYHEVGGVDGALAQRAESVYAALSPGERALARRVLLRLTDPGPRPEANAGPRPEANAGPRPGANAGPRPGPNSGAHPGPRPGAGGEADSSGDVAVARRRVTFAELPGLLDEAEDVERVVDRLVASRLLTVGGSDDEGWVEVAHEALLDGWPRLRRWIDESRSGLRVHRRLTAAVDEWERLGRDPTALYRGAQLAEVLAWAERHPDEPNARERAFITAARAEEEAERRQRLRRLRLVSAGLAVGLLVVSALAGVALFARALAEEQRLLAESRHLAAEASAELSLDPAGGLALAVEAVERAPTREAVAALREALVTPRPIATLAEVDAGDLALHPDGSRLAIADPEGGVSIEALDRGSAPVELAGHDAAALRTRFSPDGELILTGGDDGAGVWDASTGESLHRHREGETVLGTTWAHGGETIATVAVNDQTIELRDARTGALEATLDAPEPVGLLASAPESRWLLAWSSTDAEVFVFDLAENELATALEAHEPTTVDADLSPDGEHAVTVGFDGAARVWRLRDGELVTTVDGFAEQVWVARFDPSGELLAVGDGVGNVRVVELAGGSVRLDEQGHSDTLTDAAFSPDGRTLVTTGRDGAALVWDVASGRERALLPIDGATRRSVGRQALHITPDSEHVLVGGSTVQAWTLPTVADLAVPAHDAFVSALSVSPDGTRAASGAFDGTIRVWDLDSGERLAAMEVPDSIVRTVSWDRVGERLLTAAPFKATTASEDFPPVLWDASSGAEATTLPVPAPSAGPCRGVCQTTRALFTPDGDGVVTSGQEGVVRWWDGDSLELQGELEPLGEGILDIALRSDGAEVALASASSVTLWEAEGSTQVADLDGAAVAVAYAPDDERLAVAGQDGVVRLWEPRAETDARVAELRHVAGVEDVAWSPNGRFLLTAAGEGAHLWDVESQQRIHTFAGQGAVGRVAVTDDERLLLGAADGTLSVHRCTVCGTVDDLLDTARDALP